MNDRPIHRDAGALPLKSPLALLLAVAFLWSGCTSFELARLRNDVADQLPSATIGDGYSVSFGSISLGMARWITSLSVRDEDGAMVQAALHEVRRIQFGRYEVAKSLDARRLTMPRRFEHYLARGDWSHLATLREADHAIWVLYRERDERVTDVFAVALTEDELILVKLTGDLEALVTAVLHHSEVSIPALSDSQSNGVHAVVAGLAEADPSLER